MIWFAAAVHLGQQHKIRGYCTTTAIWVMPHLQMRPEENKIMFSALIILQGHPHDMAKNWSKWPSSKEEPVVKLKNEVQNTLNLIKYFWQLERLQDSIQGQTTVITWLTGNRILNIRLSWPIGCATLLMHVEKKMVTSGHSLRISRNSSTEWPKVICLADIPGFYCRWY